MTESQTTPLHGARVIILDADGVLRRLPDGTTLEGLEAFETFLRLPQFQDVLVVAAGEWKRRLRIQRIRELFSADVAARIVDATPEVARTKQDQTHEEIFAWLAMHSEIAKYVIVEHSLYAPLPPETEIGAFVHSGEVFSETDYEKLGLLLGLFSVKQYLREQAATDQSGVGTVVLRQIKEP